MVLPSVSCLFMWPPATEAYTPSAVLTKVPEMNLIGSLLSHALWPKASDTLKSRSWAAGRTWEPGLESEPQDPRTWEKGERTFAQRTGEQVLHRQTQQLCLKHYLLPVFFKGGGYNNTIKECSGNTPPMPLTTLFTPLAYYLQVLVFLSTHTHLSKQQHPPVCREDLEGQ